MEEERDIVVFSDEDGNEIEMEVLDYFDFEGQEYAMLVDVIPEEDEQPEEMDVYLMKVVVSGDMEEFLPADEDKMDELTKYAEKIFEGWEEEDADDPE